MAQDYVLLTASASARELGFLVPPSDAPKGRIPLPPRGEFLLPPLGDWKISPPLLRQELRRGLTLSRYMEPDAADFTPAGRQPNRSKKKAESAPLDAHSKIDSIVLNAPVADVYAYCSRFEELPRFLTSLRDVQKIDETHFSFTSLLDGKEYRTVVQIVLRIPERRIVWQAMPDNFPRGVVLFEPLSNRTTEITVRLRSSTESVTLAKVTRDYLTNFKRVLERTSTP
jgi:Polyketide cyclase / dehydrase and lipid transport